MSRPLYLYNPAKVFIRSGTCTLLICIFLCIVPAVRSVAQSAYYNLNIDNGLPSNHVYNATVDHLGYVWITTPKGIVKYNGYNCITFNSTDGLPNEDVWYLMEDKMGKMWIGCVANEIGYLQENKYHGVTIDTNYNTVYPLNFAWFQNGVVFATSYTNGGTNPTLYTFFNDNLNEIQIPNDSFSRYIRFDHDDSSKYVTANKINWTHFATYNKDSILYVPLKNYFFTFKITNDFKIKIKNIATYSRGHLVDVLNTHQRLIVGNYYLLKSNIPKNKILAVNLQSGKSETVSLADYGIDENILFCHYNIKNGDPDTSVYLFTKTYVIRMIVADKIQIADIYKFSKITGDTSLSGEDVITLNPDSLWSNLMATKRNGLLITTPHDSFYKVSPLKLDDYKLLGTIDDSIAIWWNKTNSQLIKLSNTHKTVIKLSSNASFTNAIKFGKDSLLLVGGTSCALLRISKNDVIINRQTFFSASIIDAVKFGTNSIINVSNSGFRIENINSTKNNTIYNQIAVDRFSNLSVDHRTKDFWAYTGFKVLKYNSTCGKITHYNKKYLSSVGLKRIEQIIFDSVSGNIIVKDLSNLWTFDSILSKGHVIPGLENINLKNTNACIYKHKLFITGKLGVVWMEILGRRQFSKPRIFLNNKKFNIINATQFCNDELLLSTDKQAFVIDISSDNLKKASSIDILNCTHKLIINNGRKTVQQKNGDTILIPIGINALHLDLINPFGSGNVKYYISTNSNPFIALSNNEYEVSQLDPDRYYTIHIRASDEIWNSPVHTFILYRQPKWYQKRIMVNIILIAIILLFILAITTSILVTRRLVLNATKKRNARMELELKSIYAQINPHFIFNSLNSALLLVSKNKTEEAYTHISKFSKLLRSYIKSSRNKLILLSDEIKNLTNYIDLQQVRFKNKFNYTIVATDQVRTDDIYIPSLLLQPFVENAIEHGLLNKEETGNLEIRFEKDKSGNHLICTIDDDGIGRQESKLNKIPNPTKDESYGELLIKDLVNIFNKYEHMNIQVSYTDKMAPQTGTIVTIQIYIAERAGRK